MPGLQLAHCRIRGRLDRAGNHERAVCGQITTETFSNTAARAVAWTRERLMSDDLKFLASLPLKADIDGELLAVHGALHPETGCEIVRLDNDERRALSFEALMADPSGARLCAFGHTHEVATYEFRNGRTVLRPQEHVRLRDDRRPLERPQKFVGAYQIQKLLFDVSQKTKMLGRSRFQCCAIAASIIWTGGVRIVAADRGLEKRRSFAGISPSAIGDPVCE